MYGIYESRAFCIAACYPVKAKRERERERQRGCKSWLYANEYFDSTMSTIDQPATDRKLLPHLYLSLFLFDNIYMYIYESTDPLCFLLLWSFSHLCNVTFADLQFCAMSYMILLFYVAPSRRIAWPNC